MSQSIKHLIDQLDRTHTDMRQTNIRTNGLKVQIFERWRKEIEAVIRELRKVEEALAPPDKK